MTYDELAKTGLFEIRAPRYTSYPPATVFKSTKDDSDFKQKLSALDPSEPVSVYVHIPFCERLCWFCACRTQGVRSLTPVQAYVDTLLTELAMASAILPRGITMGQLHFGGGTPTILSPDLITKLMNGIDAIFRRADDFESSVEIDPTLVDSEKINRLAQHGVTRASIGVQDFDPDVQKAIGREQSFETTQSCVTDLRAADVTSLNIDLVYGLAHQTPRTLAQTLDLALSLDPDRFSLFGYAHVPHMAKRQRLIPEQALPDDKLRYALFNQAATVFETAGYVALGIDHFAKPGDSLVKASENGTLRRNFQGYTTDTCPSLIAFGASAISKIDGYFQNTTGTANYSKQIQTGVLPVAKQHIWSSEDKKRSRVIEMLLCDYLIDVAQLRREFGTIGTLRVDIMACAAEFSDHVTLDGDVLRIKPDSAAFVRVIAQRFDAYRAASAIYSRVS